MVRELRKSCLLAICHMGLPDSVLSLIQHCGIVEKGMKTN